MNIDPLDYVNEDEIREAILDNFRHLSDKDLEQILTNSSYYVVSKLASEKANSIEKRLETKLSKVVDNMSSYEVFSLDVNNREPKARRLLDEIVDKNKSELEKKVKETFDNVYSSYNVENHIADAMSDAIYELFSQKPNSNDKEVPF